MDKPKISTKVETKIGEKCHRSYRVGMFEPMHLCGEYDLPTVNNEQRAHQALALLEEFADRENYDDLTEAATDVIANILHWAHRSGVDSDKLLARAKMHFEAETE